MSGFQLEAMDGSGCTPLPSGETVIGRGPFLGIGDKRVSRSHALLEVVDDRLRIKPVHVNPCFYQEAAKNTFLSMERNEWHWLNSGDCISLLPDKYAFRIIDAKPVQKTLRNSEILDDDTLSNEPDTSMNAPETQRSFDNPSSSISDTSKKALLQSTQDTHLEKVKSIQDDPPPADCNKTVEKVRCVQRQRVLPEWMLQGKLDIQRLSCPVIKAGNNAKRSVRRERNFGEGNGGQSLSGRKHLLTQEDKDDQENSYVKKKNINPTLQPEVPPGPSTGSFQSKMHAQNVNDIHKRDLLDDEEDMDLQNNENVTALQLQGNDSENGQKKHLTENQPVKPCKPTHSNTTNEDDQSQSPEAETSTERAESPQSAPATSSKRTPCMYGEGCYRKNPVHFQEFCHPGDSDYCESETGSQDDRPECPYGTGCYRKNPQHKLQYKHTKSPEKGGRRLRRRPAKKGKSALDGDSDNDGEANEYDLDDSFIDDDEEDFDFTDEDSDWMPDSEDKDTEDMNVLLKEAKKFVKGKQ